MTTPIREEYFRQRSDLVEADKRPNLVIFSQWGWAEALKEESRDGVNITHGPNATYCGLPRTVDPRPDAPKIVVTELTPTEYFQPKGRQNAITVKVDGIMGGAPVVEIIAGNLKASQLQDICRAWLDSDDATHWGEFEKGLDELITKHGRFE